MEVKKLKLSAKTDKNYNMKQFINNVRQYIETKAEEFENSLIRHLQLISVTTDLGSFDPHSYIVGEFFVSLHELLAVVDPESSLAWSGVNVLSAACKNSAARTSLIHTYHFLPFVSKMLTDNLNMEKKFKLLTLLQELTCGIKILCQIPQLPHLMSTLTKWIQCSEDKIITLSLSILVNLCYKNLPAVYTLSRCVDLKKFIRICMPLKGVNIEIHVCKLLIILDYLNGKVPEGVFLKLTEVTFKSLIDAYKARDSILLRQITEFFFDIWNQNDHNKVLQSFSNYDSEIDILISVGKGISLLYINDYFVQDLENTYHGGGGDVLSENEPVCVTIMFGFLDFVIKLRPPNLKALDLRLVNLTLKWIQVDLVCSNALAILRTVAVNTTEETCIILDPFLTSLPILLLSIENEEEEIPTHTENNKRLASLMELLRALMKAETTRKRVIAILKEDLFVKIFRPLIGSSVNVRASNVNTSSTEAVLLYANSIALIEDLLKYDERWIDFFTDLMQNKQIHVILAQALYYGSKETKTLILSISSSLYFPIKDVSLAMYELQPSVQADFTRSDEKEKNLYFPMMSVTQTERLDEIMNKIQENFQQKNLVDTSTADLLELYDYKLASLNHAERAAVASAEAASLRCTHLQHRTAQLTAEMSRLHQLLLHAQHSHESTLKTNEAVLLNNKQLQEWLDAEKSKYSTQISLKEKIIIEKTQLLEETSKRLNDVDEQKNILEDKLDELKRVVTKLEDNLVKKEKLLEKKEEALLRANANIDGLKTQVSESEKQLKRTESELASKTRELTETSKELHNCKSILGTITQLTNSQFAKPNY
ncbi:hypothetical protein FQR65_LT11191 [Abscondita terminalis]|nr:hypothetical protein FQR65_LT11191 [Abscondita terminalis]